MGVESASSEKYSRLKLVLSGLVPILLLAGLVTHIIINGTGLRDYVPAPLNELSLAIQALTLKFLIAVLNRLLLPTCR